ncbi:MAG: RNA-binding protein [Candidatus Levybacteria bacterium RIFCSPLOWO2_01_FULL_39_10]|nr:MAG: RNA-binding protein [Candidatus Levybacteria bacterium RIFCSPLOWO2_01_FULL_39_10]
MSYKLFVGSLAWGTTEDSLKDAFSKVGKVESVAVIKDRNTGRSRGFGFVEMSTEEEGKKAVAELNGKDLDGRQIVVNEARPREDNGGRGNFGGNS